MDLNPYKVVLILGCFFDNRRGFKSIQLIIKEIPMNKLKIVLLVALFTICTSAFATGSKQVPPIMEKSIYETIVEFFTS